MLAFDFFYPINQTGCQAAAHSATPQIFNRQLQIVDKRVIIGLLAALVDNHGRWFVKLSSLANQGFDQSRLAAAFNARYTDQPQLSISARGSFVIVLLQLFFKLFDVVLFGSDKVEFVKIGMFFFFHHG